MSYYILTQDNNVSVTFDNSSTTLTSFAPSPVLNRTLNGTTWYLYRRVEQAAPSTDYNVTFESNSGTPIHVWAGFGKNLEGAYANFSAFKSPNTDTDGDGVNDSSDTDRTLPMYAPMPMETVATIARLRGRIALAAAPATMARTPMEMASAMRAMVMMTTTVLMM